MRPYLNKVVQPKFDGLASAEFIVFPTLKGIDNRFIHRRISASDFVDFACSQYEGDRPRVKFDQLGKFELAMPPAAEQARIVDKLDELFTELDAGVAELQTVQKKLVQYRQSLLKSAVEGALTADWRDVHPPQESGEALLARILQERRARWEVRQLDKFKAQGKAPPKGWQGKYQEPVLPNVVCLPEIPASWCWASLEQIAADEPYSLAIGPFGSNLKVEDYRSDGVPLVFVRNIRSGKYGGLHTKFITEVKAVELTAHAVAQGDVLITKMGEPPGDADVYPEGQPLAIITADCIKVRCQPGLALPKFVEAAINSSMGRSQIKPMTQGVAQKKVSLGRFSRMVLPLPPMEEQVEILDRLEARMDALADQDGAVSHGLRLAGAQRQNILRAAFTGQLVPQNPTDEPASVLLERILAERAEGQSTKKPPGRKKAAA